MHEDLLTKTANGTLLGTSGSTKCTWSVDPELYWSIVPRGIPCDFKAARTPPFPKVPMDLEGEALVYRYYQGLCAACFHRLGLTEGGATPSSLKRRKAFPSMLQACTRLRDFGVPPHGWGVFVYSMWIDSMERYSKVPPKWALSPKLVGDRVTWARQYLATRVYGGRLVPAPILSQLAHDYSALTLKLSAKRPSTREAIGAIVDGYFPGRSFEARLHSAREEASQLQKTLQSRIDKGLWVW